jgi:hypothetical protein
MLCSFVFHIVSYWRNDKLHVTLDGATPLLALRVRMSFSPPVVWAWRTSRMDFMYLVVWSWTKGELCRSKVRTRDELKQQIRYTLPFFLLTSQRKELSVCFQVAELLAKCRGLC